MTDTPLTHHEIELLKRRVKEAERLIKRVVTDVNWRTDNKSLWVDLCAFHRETRADK